MFPRRSSGLHVNRFDRSQFVGAGRDLRRIGNGIGLRRCVLDNRHLEAGVLQRVVHGVRQWTVGAGLKILAAVDGRADESRLPDRGKGRFGVHRDLTRRSVDG